MFVFVCLWFRFFFLLLLFFCLLLVCVCVLFLVFAFILFFLGDRKCSYSMLNQCERNACHKMGPQGHAGCEEPPLQVLCVSPRRVLQDECMQATDVMLRGVHG